MKPYPRAVNIRPRLDVGRATRNRKRKRSRFPALAVGILLAAAFAYGGFVISGSSSDEATTTVSTSAKVASDAMRAPSFNHTQALNRTTPVESQSLRGAPKTRAPVVVSPQAEASPRGASSGIRRGEVLPGERLEGALRRMGVAQTEIRRLVRSLVPVFDAADSHAGDTFIAQTDSAGAVLWFELSTLRGSAVGVRRQDADLVAYRRDKAPGPRRPVTGSSAHVGARNG